MTDDVRELRAVMATVVPMDEGTVDELVNAALDGLTSRMRVVLWLRFNVQPRLALKQVGERIDPPVGAERVRQIEAKAIRMLRHPSRGLIRGYEGSVYVGGPAFDDIDYHGKYERLLTAVFGAKRRPGDAEPPKT